MHIFPRKGCTVPMQRASSTEYCDVLLEPGYTSLHSRAFYVVFFLLHFRGKLFYQAKEWFV